MVACPDAETLASLASDGLSGPERAAVANHAAACDSCRELISALLGLAETSSTQPRAPAPAQLTPGSHVDRYIIEARLGVGGMGVVYAARDPELGRRVAIKLLHPGAEKERLRREAQALARLSHPNVVAVHDVGEHGGDLFVAMALVEGANLRQWLRTSRPSRSVAEVFGHLVAAGRGLAAAHAAGLLHRDLKPDNIFVSDEGQVLVGDFGLARAVTELEPAPEGNASAPRDAVLATELTATGMVLGTPAYMPPEQADGEATAASDQFSFAVTAWEALYGERPFAGANMEEIHAAIRAGRFAPLRDDPGVPREVHRALVRALAADPAARFPSIDALLDAMTPRRPRWPLVAGGLAAVAAAGGAAVLVATMMSSPDGASTAARARCARSGDLMDATWSAPRRASLAEALGGREPAAAAEIARALAAVDARVARWSAVRQAVCTSSEARRDDLVASRTACLDQRTLELGAHLEVAAADAAVTAGAAWSMIDDLPPVERCARARDVTAPPRTPALDEARAQLAAVSARTDDRWGDVVAARRRIEPLGDPSLLLDALLLEASVALDRRDLAAAERAARSAHDTAERLADDLAKAHAGALLTEALVRLGRVPEARGQLAQATAALERAGGDWIVEAALDGARAMIARGDGDLPGEIAARQRALEQQSAHRDDDSRGVLAAAVELMNAYQRAGRLTEAAAVFDRIELAGGRAGSDKLAAAADRATVAGTQALLAGEFARAIEQGRIVIAIQHEQGVSAAERAPQVFGLAMVYEFAGEWMSARDAYRDSARLLREAAGDPVEELGLSLEGVARNELQLGHAADAVAPAREALALARAAGDADRVETATLVLAGALTETAAFDEAIALLEPVHRALESSTAAKPNRRAGAAFSLAQALWSTGGARERERARSLVGDAVRDYTSARVEYAANPLWASATRLMDERLAAATAWRDTHR
ncbi:MAG TPA: serine/threonine-protein kinase [Kofleriaceae bacterium]|nr:serine/threonine-protein kinase [Kofleriaceae bacterium]